MYDEVTQHLVMVAATPNPSVEFSRATSLADFNAAMFEAWVMSADGAFTDVVVYLEGSNDLCNWYGGLATVTMTTEPDYAPSGSTGAIPWAWVRLRYEAKGAGTRIAIRGAIHGMQAS